MIQGLAASTRCVMVFIVANAFWLCATDAAAQARCERVPVDGVGIHTCVTAARPNTVVLAAGAGQSSRTWTALAEEVSAFATVVTFDRPGFGSSDPGKGLRTPTRVALELGSVLGSLDVAEPVVLVGHSMGGLHVLRFAALFPSRVKGIVLVDTPPPGFEDSRRGLLSEEARAERVRVLSEGATRMTEPARQEREGAESPAEWEFDGFPDEISIVVIVADSQDFGELGSQREHRQLWVARSREWLDLSVRSEFVIAEGSGHMVHRERLSLVIEQIRRLVGG